MNAKTTVSERIEAKQAALLDFSHWIHQHPELGLEEHASVQHIREFIESELDVPVTVGIGGLPTAFSASVGSGELIIAICAEYDALPQIGHGCGHNVIATAAVGAFVGLAEVADELGATIRLVGTPAEENAGGKVTLIDAGVFDDVHAAMMIHPAPGDYARFSPYASSAVRIEFEGKEAHASTAPHKGVNALDAMTIMMTSIGLARQGLEPGEQIHGFVSNGGAVANVIPGHTSGTWMARAKNLEGLKRVLEKLEMCAKAGAVATGAKLTFESLGSEYADLVSDPELTDAYIANAAVLGRTALPAMPAGGSTDMGNVSHHVPSIHPMIGLDVADTVNLHTVEFAEAAGGATGDRAALDGARLLAWTAVDAATTPNIREHLLSVSSKK